MSSHVSTPDGPLQKGGAPIQKAARLLSEDRVQLLPAARVYRVRGENAFYDVIASPDGAFCPCAARTPLCSHVLAVLHCYTHARAIDEMVEGQR